MPLTSLRRRVLSNAYRPAVDQLETRRHLDAVPWNLSVGSLVQTWENPSLITANDDWNGVPSIEGYFQTAGPANRDPQTILTDANSVVDVVANQTSGNATNGGVLEVQLSSPISVSGSGTVGMQGSDAADDPYLKIYLDNSGRSSPVRIRYDLIDIDSTAGGAGTAQQSFALQYRLSASGDYTNVPAGYIQNAADFTTGATGLTNSFDVTLPNDTVGASIVQVRILTTNSAGSDQMVAVDNIRVFGSDVFAFQPTSYSVNEDAGTLGLTVKRLGGLNGVATVDYALVNGSAAAPGDFVAASGTVTFADQVDTQTIIVTLVNDSVAETLEQFTATLSNPSAGFSLGADATATISINDEDAPVPTVVLNEIKSNPPYVDTAAEYIELLGTPNSLLSNVYVLSIEGDGAGSGVVDLAFNLSSVSLGSNGYLLIGGTTTTAPAGTTVFTDTRFANAGGILENGSNSFAIVYSPSPIAEGSDFDANGDGVLELPAGAILIDAVGSLDGGATDIAYGAILSPPSGAFHAATRFPGNLTPLSADAWYSGNLLEPSLNIASETGVYDPSVTAASANLPLGAVLTPGAANYPTGANAGAFVLIPISQTVEENAGTASFGVYRAGGAVGAASVTITTGGSATSGLDYTGFDQTLNFADGEYLKTITITLTDDSLSENAETIDIQLTSPVGATILREGLGRVTIASSDLVPPTGLLLNELDVNPPGADQPYEYVELRGQAGTQLANVYLLSIEGSGANAGILDQVINLTGATLGSNGLLMIKGLTGGFTPEDAATGVFGDSTFDNTGIETDTNTVMLAFVPVGMTLPSEGTDLDDANGGTLSLDPSIVVLDSVAWLDPDAGDIGYGGAVLSPLGTAAGDGPDALVRFRDDTDAVDATAWYYGNLDTTGSLQSQVNFGTLVSGNFPVGGKLTPGAVNAPSGDTVAPTVISSVFTYQTGSGFPQTLTVTFSEDVEASLAESDFSLVNLDTNQSVGLVLADISGGGTVATLLFSGTGNALGSGILNDGHYRLRVLAGQVADASGNTLAADNDANFAFKNADFDGDLDVDFDNLLTLAQNYGGSGKTFAEGDVNYDGAVNFDDLLALAQRYGTSLFSATPISKAAAKARRGAAGVIA